MTEESGNDRKPHPTMSDHKELWNQYMELITKLKNKDNLEKYQRYFATLCTAHCSNIDIPKDFSDALQNKERVITANSIKEEMGIIVKQLNLLIKCNKGEELSTDDIQFLLSREMNMCECDVVYQYIFDMIPETATSLPLKEELARHMSQSIREGLKRFEEGINEVESEQSH